MGWMRWMGYVWLQGASFDQSTYIHKRELGFLCIYSGFFLFCFFGIGSEMTYIL